MKYLLLFVLFMVLAFQWRQSRKPKVQQARTKAQAAGAVNMVACAQCGVHLPEADAIQGARGLYCSTAHRQAQEP